MKTPKFLGKWQIYEMDLWDVEESDEEEQAYIQIDSDGSGQFQFALVSGDIDGEIISGRGEERFEFTWEGADECDTVFGAGWIQLKDKDTLEGKIKFHRGDSSGFLAKRIKSKPRKSTKK